MPLWLPAAITAGASLIGDLFNNSSQQNANQQQRQWALQDWNRQNDYNSPASQMQRYKDAGLNPNLIYGSASYNAPPVRSTDYVAPQIHPDKITQGYFDTRQQTIAMDNLQKQKELMDANLALIKANTVKTQSETDWRNLNVQNLSSLLPYNIDMAHEKIRNLAQSTTNLNASNMRAWDLLKPTIDKIKSDTSLNPIRKDVMLAQISNLNNDRSWKNLSEPKKLALLDELTQNKYKSTYHFTPSDNNQVSPDILNKILSLIKF